MQVWLHPVDAISDDTSPIAAVLVRIQQVCSDAGYHDQTGNLQRIVHDACYAMPGNLDQAKGQYDPSAYAAEVINTERVRVGFWDRLRAALDEIARVFDPVDGIDWCLPFLDYDMNFLRHDRFIAGLGRKFPYLECYLCVADTNTPLVQNWKRQQNVVVIGDDLLKTVCPQIGFPNAPPKMVLGANSALPPTPSGGILPAYNTVPSVNGPEGEDEDEWSERPRQQKKKKQYRSIDDM